MKVYKDNEAAVASLTTTSTTRPKSVNFTSSERNNNARTPFRNRNHNQQLSPGATPKPSTKSPSVQGATKTPDATMTLSSFRQSLKTPPPPRTVDGKENSQNHKNRHIGSKSKSIQTPTSASALRRSLRNTIQPNHKHGLVERKIDSGKNQQPSFPLGTSNRMKSTTAESVSSSLIPRRSLIDRNRSTAKATELGPPRRVIPQTPNSLLRTELEVLNSSSSMETEQDESLLLSPAPGALWKALNLATSGVSTSNGLVVVSPQVAEKLHDWSTSKKNLSADPTAAAIDDDGLTSPTVPRALSWHSPITELKLTCADETGQDAHYELFSNKDTAQGVNRLETLQNLTNEVNSLVQKESKGGVAMDLTEMFSPERVTVEQKATEKTVRNEKETPLSASLPPSVLSRLHANRRLTPQPTMASNQATKKVRTFRTEKSDHSIGLLSSAKRNISLHQTQNKQCYDGSEKSPSVTAKSASQINSRNNHSEKPRKTRNSESTDLNSINVEAKQDTEKINIASVNEHRGGLAFDISFPNENQPILRSTLPKLLNGHVNVEKKDDDDNDLEAYNLSRWADKQCECFIGWLDFIFNPEEENFLDGNSSAAGLRTLLIHRRLSQVRNNAAELFYSNSMRTVRTILLKEIGGGRLSIRTDRDLTADVQLRMELTKLLLSYTTPWLRMGLEVMFGEAIEPWPVVENGPRVRVLLVCMPIQILGIHC
jgi:hypothetical protein